MKTFDIQKHLLTIHLGLKGIDKDLLDTFPLQNLLEKSDTDVAVTYCFEVPTDQLEDFEKFKIEIGRILKIEPESIEEEDDHFEAVVFYNSMKFHWSSLATVHYEALLELLISRGIKVTINVSINN